MKILITGGAGFVGRRFCKALLEQQHEVVCVDSLAKDTGCIHPEKGWFGINPFDYRNFTFHNEDCRDYFKKHQEGFDEVYHLAAMVGGRLMIENFPLAVGDDLSIDAMYWQWAQANNIKKTIYFSSSAAYPITLQKPEGYRLLREEDIDFSKDLGMPDLSYGWAKLTGEYIAKLAYEKHGLKSVVYRPFSGYGEDQDLAYPFPSICLRALENNNTKEFQVWGSGRQMRDFIHIEDCVKGVLATKDKIDDGSAINLSSGVFTSFIDLAQKVTNLVGYNPEVKGKSDKPEGVFARGGDITKQLALGFKPSISLEDGIRGCLNHLVDTRWEVLLKYIRNQYGQHNR
ncbi:MAG: NAD-dependent epimerase/dehydratase family protein [Candidatus Doudnabacteria bacterium]|nr:NAD-dependent epimerase/dehydratase family protein [Candidatus Doudnabacteria bacterium]